MRWPGATSRNDDFGGVVTIPIPYFVYKGTDLWIFFFPLKLSLKVEYACRVLAQLSRSYGSRSFSRIDELAELEEIPANYLVQILNDLRNGGLIISRRGKLGGYRLAKPPAQITLFDIVFGHGGRALGYQPRVETVGRVGVLQKFGLKWWNPFRKKPRAIPWNPSFPRKARICITFSVTSRKFPYTK